MTEGRIKRRQNMNKKIILAVVAIAIIGSIVWLQSLKPTQTTSVAIQTLVATSTPESTTASTTSSSTGYKLPTTSSKYLSPAQKAAKYEPGIELAGVTNYLNLPSGESTLTLKQLVGKKVILVDFWTYSCINCQRTLPYLTDWYKKYQDQGLVIIGVHTPEFEFEKDPANVQMALAKYGITYPVVQDNNYGTWNAYSNRYWPHHFLIDIDGYIVEDHIGEGGYDTTEKKIQELIAERADRLKLQASVNMPLSRPVVEATPRYVVSPETYFGTSRNEYLGKTLELVGSWKMYPEYASNEAIGDKIRYSYTAQYVYFVAQASQSLGTKSNTVEILRDGKPLTAAQAGEDVVIGVDGKSTATISEARLYKLIKESSPQSHIIEIIPQNPGLQAFTFTFG